MPDDQQILELRPHKKKTDPFKPYHFLHEREMDAHGTVREVNTIFLTNKECPFKCVMCDLWKHTLDEPTPSGAIPAQIKFALERLPEASVVKLYNNGNFFDTRAIPPEDYSDIADLLFEYDTIIVENHPKLCGDALIKFQSIVKGSLEVAMGLETIHPEVLPKLNKQITTDNFQRAANFLIKNNISFRAFILLNPPFLTDAAENIKWAVRSADFAFDHGAGVCSIIPTRPGNGIMDKLQQEGKFIPPTLSALEETFQQALALSKGRAFADLWDLKQFSTCRHCFEDRKNRLQSMNLEQKYLPAIKCKHH